MITIPGLNKSGQRIALRHGGGGRAMRMLIEEVFMRGASDIPVDGVGLAAMDDGAAAALRLPRRGALRRSQLGAPGSRPPRAAPGTRQRRRACRRT